MSGSGDLDGREDPPTQKLARLSQAFEYEQQVATLTLDPQELADESWHR